MRVRLLVSAVTSAAAVGAAVPLLMGAASASAEPSAQELPVVAVALSAPGSVTHGAGTDLTAKVSVASASLAGRPVQFVSRPVGAAAWQVLGSATTGQDGTTTLPVPAVEAPTEYGAYYAESDGAPVRSRPATTVVHVIDVQPKAPTSVAYKARTTIAATLLQDGSQPLSGQQVQVRFRPDPHARWGRAMVARTDAHGVASVKTRLTHTVQVGIRFAGAGDVAASPLRVATVRVGPRPAVAADGFRFPLLDASRATSPSTWSLDQGVDLFAVGQACGAAAKLVAVGDGTVVQTGIQGFGPTAPVIRMSSGPFKGRNVYYGHTGRVYVHPGQQVHIGDLVAEIGCGRVGLSSAPHLEIGVGLPGGPPCCPGWHQTSSLMMRELVASLGRR